MANTEATASSSMQDMSHDHGATPPAGASPTPPRYWPPPPLVMLSACLVLLGTGGPLLLRIYFVHGGRRLWLSTAIQLSGWPLLLPLIGASLLRGRRRGEEGIAGRLLPPRLAGAVAVLGALFGASCYVYSLGARALPLSTSALLQATQLAFNAVFAFLFAGLRFTPFSANAVVLLTVGPAVLGVRPRPSSSGAPAGEGGEHSSRAYWIGFSEAIAAAALSGLVLPLVEVAKSRYGRRRSGGPAAGVLAAPAPAPPTYVTVMQIQAVMGAAGTAVCLLGMAVTGDFQAVPGEAAAFGLGRSGYYLVFVSEAVSWQLFNLGVMGLIVCGSSLLAGIMVAVALPLSEVLAVVFLREKLDGSKGIALVLSLWGFVSYLYGEKTQTKTEASQSLQAEKSCDLMSGTPVRGSGYTV